MPEYYEELHGLVNKYEQMFWKTAQDVLADLEAFKVRLGTLVPAVPTEAPSGPAPKPARCHECEVPVPEGQGFVDTLWGVVYCSHHSYLRMKPNAWTKEAVDQVERRIAEANSAAPGDTGEPKPGDRVQYAGETDFHVAKVMEVNTEHHEARIRDEDSGTVRWFCLENLRPASTPVPETAFGNDFPCCANDGHTKPPAGQAVHRFDCPEAPCTCGADKPERIP